MNLAVPPQIPNLPSANSSSKSTFVICPSISILATASPIKPVLTSLLSITTSLLICRPTATRFPIAFVVKCRGKLPYAGANWRKVSVPSSLREKVEMLSEKMGVEFVEGFGFGSEKEESFLLPIMRNRLSGCKDGSVRWYVYSDYDDLPI